MRWIKRIGLGLIGLVVAVAMLVYAVSEYQIRRDRGIPLGHVTPDRSPAGLVEGQRLARINGCYSCHGAAGHGNVMVDIPHVVTLTAPPLSIAAASSDGQLARTIQHSVSRDGRGLWVMPAHRRMAESDLAMIMGHLRTLKPGPADIARRRSFGPIGRVLMVTGRVESETKTGELAPKTRPADLGSYLTTTICLGCHLIDKPQPFGSDGREIAPPLAMMGAAYDDAAFTRLLRTGQGLSAANLGTMSNVSKDSFHYFRDDEIAAIHAYLRARAATLPPG